MPRFIVEVVMSQGLIKNLVDNPRDRFSELVPVYQETGITFEQRYYVVGENKLIDIVSADSADALQALVLSALASGAVTSTTCRQITSSTETVPILQQAKESPFTPPNS